MHCWFYSCRRLFFISAIYISDDLEAFFEGDKTFLTTKLSWAQRRAILGSKNSSSPRKTEVIVDYMFCQHTKKASLGGLGVPRTLRTLINAYNPLQLLENFSFSSSDILNTSWLFRSQYSFQCPSSLYLAVQLVLPDGHGCAAQQNKASVAQSQTIRIIGA